MFHLKIVFIGAGNLAVHLSQALQNAGFEIAQVYSRTEASAGELAGLLQAPYTASISRIVDDASLYIISVSDDAIGSVLGSLNPAGLVVHTAGSVPMDIFSGKLDNYGVLYPLQTFSKSRPVDFTGIPLFIEANTPDSLQQLRMVAGAISQKVYCASSEERMQLHLAAVFGCNFVNHLYHLSAQIAQQVGFNFDVLSSLALETARKAIASGNPQQVQTGPAVRGDRHVTDKHLELLAAHPVWQAIYAMLSENIGKVKNGE
ncbi:MAG: DUF2520 domain-containing protein [Bacteroidales bacterium]|jgi:predicted short-subunit dehydrogenase-like oxidoreductase (DUF2520 family)|nr:DUF2520 domain-containing protein [Bacteroidales bacterium]